MNIQLRSYGGFKTNAHIVQLGALEVYFSYDTPVAVRDTKGQLFVRENTFSKTTGQHINAIDGGKKHRRWPSEIFERMVLSSIDWPHI